MRCKLFYLFFIVSITNCNQEKKKDGTAQKENNIAQEKVVYAEKDSLTRSYALTDRGTLIYQFNKTGEGFNLVESSSLELSMPLFFNQDESDLIKYEDPSCNSEPDPTCADEDEKCKNSASSCVSTLTDTVEELESIVRRSYTAADSVATSCEGYQAKVTEHGLDTPSSEDRSDEFSEANTELLKCYYGISPTKEMPTTMKGALDHNIKILQKVDVCKIIKGDEWRMLTSDDVLQLSEDPDSLKVIKHSTSLKKADLDDFSSTIIGKHASNLSIFTSLIKDGELIQIANLEPDISSRITKLCPSEKENTTLKYNCDNRRKFYIQARWLGKDDSSFYTDESGKDMFYPALRCVKSQ